jgi:hypothetical protein
MKAAADDDFDSNEMKCSDDISNFIVSIVITQTQVTRAAEKTSGIA